MYEYFVSNWYLSRIRNSKVKSQEHAYFERTRSNKIHNTAVYEAMQYT